MSKKGQDNQKGISFQNKVALFYLLNYYRYGNFSEIKLEGDDLSDFTLLFDSPSLNPRFFYNFEVKNWQKPLTISDVQKIIRKEASERGGNYYSVGRDRFYIVAPAFSNDCVKQFNSFKDRYFFISEKSFNSQKNLYKKMYGDHELLKWSKEEISTTQNTELITLNEDQLNNKIFDRLFFEYSVYYTKGDTENLINQFLKKITQASSEGAALTKRKIRYILEEFNNQEADKSESYSSDKDFGKVKENIDQKLNTEQDFITLNDSKYITPLSQRPRVIDDITHQLKQKQFGFKTIKWFIDKVLIKEAYIYKCFQLLKVYIEKHKNSEDISSIVDIINKIYKHSSAYPGIWSKDNYRIIMRLLLKISETNQPDEIKQKIICFLDKTVPPWDKTDRYFVEEYYKYNQVPYLITNLLGITQAGIEFIFKKHNFTKKSDRSQTSLYGDYIERFVNQSFESHFKTVVDKLSKQFQDLYHKRYDLKYEGYELTGGYSGSNNQYSLKRFAWEALLARCIEEFYNKNSNEHWQLLKTYINKKCDKNHPVFIKRAFIPFLLKQVVSTSSNQKPQDNEFYKSLESIIKIKDGFPTTDEAVVHELYTINLPNIYLQQILHTILYKYSNEGVTGRIFIIQFIIDLISRGKHQFKPDLKRILMNKAIQQSYVYNQILRILDSKINNTPIKEFVNEIKSQIDMPQNPQLKYNDILNLNSNELKKHPLFNSTKKKDLDNLAHIIQKAFWDNRREFLKEVLKFLDKNLKHFYKRARKSTLLKQIIAQSPQYATKKEMKLKEKIITQCLQDKDLCGESQKLQKEVTSTTGLDGLSTSTMRSELCQSIDNYIRCNIDNPKELEKAFLWIKTLMDLDGSLADAIKSFPRPNVYLRWFASLPLKSLSYYQTRQDLNNYKSRLGNEVKQFVFQLLKQTEKEVEKYSYTPPHKLFDQILYIFDVIRDLNTQEAKTVLDFIKKFNVAEYSHLFIYYALYRDKEFSEPFDSSEFKKVLKSVCCQNLHGTLKEKISAVIYKNIKSEDKNKPPDFDFFDKMEPYWICLFKSISKPMYFSLTGVLSIVLAKNLKFYEEYKKYLFIFFKDMIKTALESGDDFTHSQEVFLVVSEKNPDDLIKILLLILKEGDTARGTFPLSYEVRDHLIPIIKKNMNKISPEEIKKAENELKKHHLTLN